MYPIQTCWFESLHKFKDFYPPDEGLRSSLEQIQLTLCAKTERAYGKDRKGLQAIRKLRENNILSS